MFIYVKIIEFIQVDDLPKYTWLALVFPIVSIVFLLNTDDYFGLLNTNPDILITTAGLAISNIILFVIFISVINSINMKHKLQAAKQKEELYDSEQTCYSFILSSYKRLLKANIINITDKAKILVEQYQQNNYKL